MIWAIGKISVVFTTGCHTATELYLDRQNSPLSKNPSHLRRKITFVKKILSTLFINDTAMTLANLLYVLFYPPVKILPLTKKQSWTVGKKMVNCKSCQDVMFPLYYHCNINMNRLH